jgi:predicted porin
VRPKNFIQPCRVKFALVSAALAVALSVSRGALAEVSIAKTDTWELFTSGRVNAFFSYGLGDANPVPRPGDPMANPPIPPENLPGGGGLNTGNDNVPNIRPDGTLGQGTFRSMRVRSGFVPNVLGIGLRRKLNEDTTVKAYIAIWATIESESQRKASPVNADAREGYLKIESLRWGSVTAGRALDLFSRGATENDFLYGHGYGLGFPGNIDNTGPTNGMIGFGVLAAFFAPGLVYTTPNLLGLQLSVGVYDPTTLAGFYEATRDVRPEAELTYDLSRGPVKVHLFGNGGYQTFYKPASNDSATGVGVGYGGRVEVGPVHLGLAGHYGKGLGLQYAFQPGDISVSPNLELRSFDGYSIFAQVVAGHLDFNAGWGISRTFALDSDKVPGTFISLPEQWALSLGVVYHVTDYLHLDVDYLHAQTHWSQGEKQVMNFINTGVTVTW